MRRLLLTALAVVVFTSSARAGYQMGGAGGVSCGTWTANRRATPRWYEEAQWVLGFLSGVGWSLGQSGYDPLRGVDADGVGAWLDNYCRAHPLKDLAEAAAAFVEEHPHQ